MHVTLGLGYLTQEETV